MSMETHNNFVSTLSDLRVETKLVSFIIICTMIIVSCFILNNAYAQSNIVSNNLFGNATKQSASKEPFLGINMRGYYTSMPQLRDGFKSPFPNNYYESSFRNYLQNTCY